MSLFVLDTDILTLFEREHAPVAARIKGSRPLLVADRNADAANRVAVSLGPGAEAVAIDTTDPSTLEALVGRLNLGQAVQFLGYQPASAQLMAQFDALIVPSIYDVHPLVAVEAMACGLPVIASAVGGLAETVVDGTTGFLVPPRRSDELASAINRLLASEALRRSMGVAARQRALEQFSPEVCVAAYAAEYRALLARRSAPAEPRT